MKRFLKIMTLAACAGLLLAGCSGMRVIESNVTAFTAWTAAPPGPNTPYRFERLPSQQQVAPAQQDRIESAAIASLARVGMVMDAAKARYSVEVVASTQVGERFSSAFGWGGPGVFVGAGNFGSSVGMSFPIGGFGEPYYVREVKILMREINTQSVVFETRVVSDGPWGDGYAILPALLDSALLGFPQPPAGTRRINVEIPH